MPIIFPCADPAGRRPLLEAPAFSFALAALIVITLLLVCVVPTEVRGGGIEVPGGDSVLWRIMQGALLCWCLSLPMLCRGKGRSHAILAAVLIVAALNYAAYRPGGWYAQASPAPSFRQADAPGEAAYDADLYWRAALQLKQGGNPFAVTWYPPPFVMAFAQLTELSPDRAFAVWWLLVCGSYLLCIVLSYELLLSWNLSVPVVGVLMPLLWVHNRPAIQSAAELQVNLMLLALLLFGYLALPRSRFLSAAGVGLATLLKIVPLTIAFFLALAGKLRWLWWYAAGLAAVVGVSMLGNGAELWGRFFRTVPPWVWTSDSLDGTLSRFLSPGAALVVALLTKLGMVAWGSWIVLAHARSRKGSGGIDAAALARTAFAVGSVCMVLVSPVLWPYHRVWFVPGILYGWSFGRRGVAPALLLVTAMLVWLPTPPLVGVIGIFLPGLLLLWCLQPANAAATAGESAAERLVEVVGGIWKGGTGGGRRDDPAGSAVTNVLDKGKPRG
jgi:hypothetical protein